jgi:hypothetical protein
MQYVTVKTEDVPNEMIDQIKMIFIQNPSITYISYKKYNIFKDMTIIDTFDNNIRYGFDSWDDLIKFVLSL